MKGLWALPGGWVYFRCIAEQVHAPHLACAAQRRIYSDFNPLAKERCTLQREHLMRGKPRGLQAVASHCSKP